MTELVCAGCGTWERLTWHHVVPRCLGGSDGPSNLVTVCQTCHAAIHYPGSLRRKDRNLPLLKRLQRPAIQRFRRCIEEARARHLQSP